MIENQRLNIQMAQIESTDGDTAANLQKILTFIQGAQENTDLIVFPEGCLMGFPTLDEIVTLAESENGPALSAIKTLVKTKNISVALGFAEVENGKYFNTTVLISPEGVLLKYRKTHLWSSDVGIFEPGNEMPTCLWKGIRVGILICFDIEFPETARALADQGAELLIVTNANMDPYGPVHKTLMTARALENQVFAVMVNRCGTGDDLVFAGESMIVNPFGEIVACLGREESTQTVEIHLSDLQKSRADYHYLKLRRFAFSNTVRVSD